MTRRRWTILLGAILLGGGLLWLLLDREPIEEGRCTLARKEVDPSAPLGFFAMQELDPQIVTPEDARDLPAGFDQPCRYKMEVASRQIPLVLNLSETPRLCLDSDGDGALAQEPCFAATRIREVRSVGTVWRFGPIAPALEDSSREADNGFYVICYRPDVPARLATRPAFFRTGKLRLDGRTYRVAVIDRDCDGRYHSILSLPPGERWWSLTSDLFAIDLNRNRKFDGPWFGALPSEITPLGRLVRIADTYYTIDIAPDGTSLALSRTEPQLGTLVIEPNDTTAQIGLWSDAAVQSLRGGEWQLPAGKYMGTYVAIQKRDSAGDVWSFSGDVSHPLGALESFVIEPDRTTRLRFGPPFVLTTEVQQTGPEVSIGIGIFGREGERYKATVERNGRRISEPTFRIVDEKGTVLVADKFQYG